MLKRIIYSIIVSLIISMCSVYVYGTDVVTTDSNENSEQIQVGDQSESRINTGTEEVVETTTEKVDTETKKETTKTEEKPQITKTEENSQNTNKVLKSSESKLQELKIDLEGLTPEFNKNITEYYLVVDLSVKQIKVTATPVDDKAKVVVLGNKNINEGKNTITIKVTAEDGTIKKYYIYVTKIDDVEMANAELEFLKLDGFNLYPSFKSNIYSYNLNIDKNIESLDITAKPQNEKATVEIEGNNDLKEGENLIKINVTAEDKTTIRTYKINTYVSSDKVEVKEEDKTIAIILIACLGVCIIYLGIAIIIKKNK